MTRTSRDWTPEEKEHKQRRRDMRRRLRESGKLPPKQDRICGKEMRWGGACKQGRYIVMIDKEVEQPDGTTKIETKHFLAPTCYAHLSRELLDKLQLRGIGQKVGRPPKPRNVDILKEQVESDIAEYLAPYREAMQAMKQVVVGNGPHARMVEVPDHRTRLQAVEAIYDRIYGKPKQSTEIQATVNMEPVEVPTDTERENAVARILAESGALPGMQPVRPGSQN